MIFPQEQDHPFSHQKHQYYYTSQTKQVEFFQHWNQQATSYPNPQCLTDQIKVQLLPQIRCLTTLWVESKWGGLSFWNFAKKGGSDFSHKKRAVVLKKGDILTLTFILNDHFQSYLSLSEWWCLLWLFTLFLNILCVSWEEISLLESNQQICDFHKSVIFEKQRNCGTL